MNPSERLWELWDPTGVRTRCHITPKPDGYLLLVERDREVTVSEHHDVPRTAIDRASAIFRQLTEQGWLPASDGS